MGGHIDNVGGIGIGNIGQVGSLHWLSRSVRSNMKGGGGVGVGGVKVDL